MGLFVMYYMFYAGLLATEFRTHFLPRTIIYMASAILVNIYRHKAGQASLGFSLTLFSILLIICEIVFYVQMKAQVKLFLASQKITI